MAGGQLTNDRRRPANNVPSTANGREAKAIPFAERLSCTIDEACEATGLGRTKLYELVATGQLITTTVGRRRLVMVRSLFALLDKTTSVA
jgi:excisionase family DNA binding protein